MIHGRRRRLMKALVLLSISCGVVVAVIHLSRSSTSFLFDESVTQSRYNVERSAIQLPSNCHLTVRPLNDSLVWRADFAVEKCVYAVIAYPPSERCEGAKVLIGVMSPPSNREMRNSIRETYANPEYSLAIKQRLVTVIFVIGTSKRADMKDVIEESNKFNDILLTSIDDVYENLPLKTHSLLQYQNNTCNGVDFLAKTDDDVIVDVDRMVNSLHRFKRERTIFGEMRYRAEPRRNPHGKWYVSRAQYPYEEYPNYLSGAFYLMTRDTVEPILNAVSSARYFSIEDAMFTGVLATKAGVKRVDERISFRCGEYLPNTWACDERQEPYMLSEHDGIRMNRTMFKKKITRLRHIKCSVLPNLISQFLCIELDICL